MDHTEVIEVEYDPRTTDYKKMLDCFWRFHDPTDVEHKRQYMYVCCLYIDIVFQFYSVHWFSMQMKQRNHWWKSRKHTLPNNIVDQSLHKLHHLIVSMKRKGLFILDICSNIFYLLQLSSEISSSMWCKNHVDIWSASVWFVQICVGGKVKCICDGTRETWNIGVSECTHEIVGWTGVWWVVYCYISFIHFRNICSKISWQVAVLVRHVTHEYLTHKWMMKQIKFWFCICLFDLIFNRFYTTFHLYFMTS
jgi:hypothetical protein